ncbi:hypothetical protein ABMC89_10410 [Sulfitobacter sp. HNIBRBA3233]|uniref:hypothetical protein n=1 Tax=Sulfitobacter marinivivus TaxID=3158558 RepID=UPI0032DE4C9E
MTQAQTDATFLIIERDPIVRMDIQETILNNFPGQMILVVASLEDIARAFEYTRGPRIVIASQAPKVFFEHIESLDITAPTGAVLISDHLVDDVDVTLPVTIVPKPFSSEHLVSALRTACETLQSSR